MEHTKMVSIPIKWNLKLTKRMCPTSNEERNEMKNGLYSKLISGLIYLANATRSDVAFVANVDPGKKH